jgi:hypothetical protein
MDNRMPLIPNTTGMRIMAEHPQGQEFLTETSAMAFVMGASPEEAAPYRNVVKENPGLVKHPQDPVYADYMKEMQKQHESYINQDMHKRQALMKMKQRFWEDSHMGEIARAAQRGYVGVMTTFSKVARTLGILEKDDWRVKIGEEVIRAQAPSSNLEDWQKDMYNGLSSAITSIGVSAPALLFSGGMGFGAGAALLGSSSFSIYSLAGYDDCITAIEEAGGTRDASARMHAVAYGLSEGATEAIADIVGAKIFRIIGTKFIPAGVKRTIMHRFGTLLGQLTKNAMIEVPGEMTNSAFQTAILNNTGLFQYQDPWLAAVDAAPQAMWATLFHGGGQAMVSSVVNPAQQQGADTAPTADITPAADTPDHLGEVKAEAAELSAEITQGQAEIKPEDNINGITREEAARRILAGDDTVLEHVKAGVAEHGTEPINDALNNQIMTMIGDNPVAMENYHKLKGQLDMILKPEEISFPETMDDFLEEDGIQAFEENGIHWEEKVDAIEMTVDPRVNPDRDTMAELLHEVATYAKVNNKNVRIMGWDAKTNVPFDGPMIREMMPGFTDQQLDEAWANITHHWRGQMDTHRKIAEAAGRKLEQKLREALGHGLRGHLKRMVGYRYTKKEEIEFQAAQEAIQVWADVGGNFDNVIPTERDYKQFETLKQLSETLNKYSERAKKVKRKVFKDPEELNQYMADNPAFRPHTRGGALVGAWADKIDGESHIFVIDSILADMYKRKAWTAPKVAGVNALKEDQFKTFDEWRSFIVNHEAAHIYEAPRGKYEKKGAYENRMNDVALDAHNAKRVFSQQIEELNRLKAKIWAWNEFQRRPDLAAQREIFERARTLSEAEIDVAREVLNAGREIGDRAIQHGVIKGHRENWVNRMWEGRGTMAKEEKIVQIGGAFSAGTHHNLQRQYASIIEGWAKGDNLKYRGAITSMVTGVKNIQDAIDGKIFIDSMMRVRDLDGQPLLTVDKQPGYKKIKHKYFRTEQPVLDKDGKPTGKTEYVELYAPRRYASILNAMTSTSKLMSIPGMETINKYNHFLKMATLMGTLFHHKAYCRSFFLTLPVSKTIGAAEKKRLIAHHVEAGLAKLENMTPLVRLGIYNGLTTDMQADWDESSFKDGIWFIPKNVQSWADRTRHYLFNEMGTGLKVQAFTIAFEEELHRQEKQGRVPDVNDIAKNVASMINNDFGGLNYERLYLEAKGFAGSPTRRHLLQLALLGPDWSLSNFRAVKESAVGSKDAKKVHQKMWRSVVFKSAVITTVGNFLSAGGDVEEMWERYKKAWEAGNFAWTKIDITPIFDLFVETNESPAYLSVPGHFMDPVSIAKKTVEGLPGPQGGLTALYHKGSPLLKGAFEFASSTNWQNKEFTRIEDFIETGNLVYENRMPEGRERLLSELDELAQYGDLPFILHWSQFPSFVASQCWENSPNLLHGLYGFAVGEKSGVEAVIEGIGVGPD